MTHHTPGPWILATSCSWRRFISLDRSRPVCVPTVANDGHPDLNITEADAALIAAAPKLLEALQGFMAMDRTFNTSTTTFLMKLSQSRSEGQGLAKVVLQARKAIAEATGVTCP